MALVLIPGPDNAPSASNDWGKINNVLQTIGLDMNSPTRISGTKILRGSVIFFAGAWYVADADTAITGNATPYVRLTNTAGTVTAAFAPSLSGVTFNRTWNGWYDSSMRLYLFDEVLAFANGLVPDPTTVKNFRPTINWAKAWSRVLSAAQLSRFFRLSSEVVLTGSGNWTVPSGVYWIEGLIIGPGSNGSAGSTYTGGRGGAAGERRYFGFSVTPGQSIQYKVTRTSTIFGGTTIPAGGGVIGGNGDSGRTIAAGGYGGNGGGKGGYGGAPATNGGNAPDGEGGGGGGGGSAQIIGQGGYPAGAGGLGGMGSVRIR
jgi:hypothetical protein